VTFLPPSAGLDPSWWSALYLAAHRGLHFGTQVVFTYGPLGFLRQPWLWYGSLGTLAFLYSAALHLVLAVSLVWALRRTLAASLAVLLAAVALLVSPEREVALGLATIWCLVALSPEAPAFSGWVVAIGGGVLAGVESLVKLQSGPVILGACLIVLVARRDRRRLVPIFLVTVVCAFAAAWFAAGQSLGNLGAYMGRGDQIVSGYSDAMGFQASTTFARLAAPVMIALGLALAAAAALTTRPRRERIGAALMVALVTFALFKESVVRGDGGHEAIFFSTLAIVAAGLAFRTRRLIALVTVVAVSAVALVARSDISQVDLNPVSHVQTTFRQVRLLLRPAQQDRETLYFAVLMAQHYQLDRATLAMLRGQTVHIDPWETAVAWVYRLHWSPTPVFQGYSAYTSELDRLGANALSSRSGPTRILVENTEMIEHRPASIDSRLPAWDPPATALATLCNFRALRTTPRWEVLGRTTNRCRPPQRIATINTRYGQLTPIRVPSRPGLLYAKVYGLGVGGVLGHVRSLLYRAPFRYAVINGSSTHRVVPGTASDGLLLDAPAGADYPAPFALSPNVHTLKFTGPSGALRIDVEWMPLSASGTSRRVRATTARH
jgi:hypothetical protein